MKKIQAKKIVVKRTKGGQLEAINLELDTKNMLILQIEIVIKKLRGQSDTEEIPDSLEGIEDSKSRQRILNAFSDKLENLLNILREYINNIEFTITGENSFKYKYSGNAAIGTSPDEIDKIVREAINEPNVAAFIYDLIIKTPGVTDGRKERLHKQPRSLLKTVAQRISNTTEVPTLFTPPIKTEPVGSINNLKQELSKNTAALAFYLMQLYQEGNSKALEIYNLSPIAEKLNTTNHRLKLYLLYLGGYTYPIIDKDKTTGELVLTNEQLFKVEFRYGQKVADKYQTNNKGEILGVERIGSNLSNFIKDEPIQRVVITPNERFIKSLQGGGLGNILTVNDKFIGLIMDLTDIATKILTYSSSNKPSHKIAEEKLIKHLGLERQVKVQGRPRVRATILKGLEELKDKEHIKNYSYNEAEGMYSFTYSDKYVRYNAGTRGKEQPPEGVQ